MQITITKVRIILIIQRVSVLTIGTAGREIFIWLAWRNDGLKSCDRYRHHYTLTITYSCHFLFENICPLSDELFKFIEEANWFYFWVWIRPILPYELIYVALRLTFHILSIVGGAVSMQISRISRIQSTTLYLHQRVHPNICCNYRVLNCFE